MQCKMIIATIALVVGFAGATIHSREGDSRAGTDVKGLMRGILHDRVDQKKATLTERSAAPRELVYCSYNSGCPSASAVPANCASNGFRASKGAAYSLPSTRTSTATSLYGTAPYTC